MALVPCPECQREVSTQALACPQCAFPFPGKPPSLAGQSGVTPHPCPDCGMGLTGAQTHEASNENVIEETWLCPHCGTPCTQNLQQCEDATEDLQGISSTIQSVKGPQISEKVTGQENHHTDSESLPAIHLRPSLWKDPSLKKDGFSPRYPRNKGKAVRKNIVVSLIFFVFVAAVMVLGALWQLEGVNPLEALAYWRM